MIDLAYNGRARRKACRNDVSSRVHCLACVVLAANNRPRDAVLAKEGENEQHEAAATTLPGSPRTVTPAGSMPRRRGAPPQRRGVRDEPAEEGDDADEKPRGEDLYAILGASCAAAKLTQQRTVLAGSTAAASLLCEREHAVSMLCESTRHRLLLLHAQAADWRASLGFVAPSAAPCAQAWRATPARKR
jgi:hypothetical protein